MADYIKVFKTSHDKEASGLLEKGWDLIETYKVSEDVGNGSYVCYSLGFSAKEHTNQLISIIKEYEKYGFKEALFEKVAEKMDDKIDNYGKDGYWPSETPLASYMSNYESMVNNKNIRYSKKGKNVQSIFED